MSNFEWKTCLIPSNIDKTPILKENDNRNFDQNIEERKEFDSNYFLQNLRLLINDNQIDKIFEIENQIKSYDTSELICVLNSRLIEFVFNEISNITDESPPDFINSCFNICFWATSIKGRKYFHIINRYLEFITPEFTSSIKKNLNSPTFLIQSLLIIANTFYKTKDIYDYYNSNDPNTISILTAFSKSEDDKVKSVCSLILKRILKCNFDNIETDKFFLPLFDSLIQISSDLLNSNSLFAHIKTFQMLSKLVRKYSNELKLQENPNFINFINHVIIHFTSSDDPLILGNILHFILSVIEVNQIDNLTYIVSFFNSISIWEIIKKGLNSTVPFIQLASSEIFEFIITYPSPFSHELLVKTDLIEFSLEIVRISNFEGKEKIEKAILYLFWRDDVNQSILFQKEGIQFLCDDLPLWPSDIIPIINRLLIRYPKIKSNFLKSNIIEILDDIIFSNEDVNEGIQIAAEALKRDILAN